MSAAQILNKAALLGVELRLDGDVVRIRGPKNARDAIRLEVSAHKPEIVAYLRCAATAAVDLSHYPFADGPFMPWCPPKSAAAVAGLLVDLRATVGKVADIEGWADEQRAYLLALLARQPISTLADDLAYFRERLTAIEAVARTCNGTLFPGHATCTQGQQTRR